MDERMIPELLIYFIILAFLAGVPYLLLTISYLHGWEKVKKIDKNRAHPDVRVSVIIPFRNEEENLPALMQAMIRQDYPSENLEFLFVDDHSSDNSVSLLSHAATHFSNLKIIITEGEGKKDALLTGIKHARGTFILQTDADALPGDQWVKVMASQHNKKQEVLVAGPVVMSCGTGFFQRLQALEHMSLTAAAVGASGTGKPVLCSGANLGYTKSLLHTLSDPFYRKVRSGDDVFLLHQVKKQHPDSILFFLDTSAAVQVFPEKGLKTFLLQRARWTGKTVYFRDPETILHALVIFMMGLTITASFLLGMIHSVWFLLTGFLYIVKSVPDYLLLRKATRYFNVLPLMRLFPVAEIFYPFYLVSITLTGVTGLIIQGIKKNPHRHWN